MESTTPVAAPAKATNGRDMDPISSSCRNNSRNSKGGVTAARTTRQKNMPRSPNHSKNLLNRPSEELTMGGTSDVRNTGSGGSKPASALDFRSIMDLSPDWALRAHR